MELAVVVVSYNVRELTRGCLTSVYAALDAARTDGHVWVVDNASADGSAQMVSETFPGATLYALDENLGYAGGANLVLRQLLERETPPPFVLVLNPDTVLRQDALKRLLEHMRAHPKTGLAGAQLAYADGGFQHGAFRFPTLAMLFLEFWPLHHRLLDSPLNGRYARRRYESGRPFSIDHPLGAAMLLRTDLLIDIGLLDESYFMYCEEIDLCLRAKRAGWAIELVPSARIVHYAGQSTQQFRERMFLALWRSRLMLFERYYSHCYLWAARRIIRAGMLKLDARVRRAVERGELPANEGQRHRQAYAQVMRM